MLLIPGVMSTNPYVCIAFLSAALGSLELTVPVSWAMTIDIGGEYSGSVSSVMNMCGNIGGALSAVIIGYIATHFGWTAPFLLASAMCVLSSLLVFQMNPTRAITSA
jgi:sugar phosphate permease